MPKIVFKDTVYGNSVKKANEVLIDKIEGSEAGNVQVAINELYQKLIVSINDVNEYKAQLDALLAGASSAYGFATLDENGKTPSSREFASLIGKWIDEGVPAISFLIGGANGHAEKLKQKADYKLSFGRMTLPHILARVVLAEQIYRAKTILDGHPYHRD